MPAGSKIFQSVLPGATVPTLAADTDEPEPGAAETGVDIRADGVATSSVILSSVAKDLRADLTPFDLFTGARNSSLTPLYLRQSQTPV
jgi:hypothetical protein